MILSGLKGGHNKDNREGPGIVSEHKRSHREEDYCQRSDQQEAGEEAVDGGSVKS